MRLLATKCVAVWRDRRFRSLCRGFLRTATEETDVLVGPNWAFRGGVRNHILALKRYSALRLALLPHDALTLKLCEQDRIGEFKSWFGTVDLNRFRAIHTHVDPWLITSCANCRPKRFAWVHTYHTLYFDQHYRLGLSDDHRAVNDALLNLARQADERICVSRWLQEHLDRQYGIATRYIPNGVDIAACDGADARRFQAAHRIDDVVLFTGGCQEIKGPLDCLRLAARLPDVRFAMAGEGMTIESIRDMTGAEPPRNVVLLGELSRADTLDAVAACSVFVMTSKTEGLPTALLEAMALRKPVVAPDLDGCLEAIGSEECGFIYRHDSLDDLVEKTRAALVDTTRGAKARERVLREYDWRVVAPRLDDVYRALACR